MMAMMANRGRWVHRGRPAVRALRAPLARLAQQVLQARQEQMARALQGRLVLQVPPGQRGQREAAVVHQ